MRLQKGPALRRPLAAAAVVAAAFTVVGIGLGESRHADAAALPACANAPAAHGLPAALGHLPLPSGTSITARAEKYGYVVYTGRVPGRLVRVRDALLRDVAGAGYRITGGDAELFEAEASFRGPGQEGRWKLRALPGCSGALGFQIALRAAR
jgi:hypothetical protein